ncbi:MAG: methyltransferase domain-containing protein [bacterium]
MNARDTLRDLTPPALWRLVRGLRRRWAGGADWVYVPGGWSEAERLRGWNAPGVAALYRERWPAWMAHLDGTGPLAWAHEAPRPGGVAEQNTHLVFAAALARAACGQPRLSVLDWGGGPGHYARLARALLPELTLDYHVCDLPGLVAVGRQLAPEVTFHEGEDWAARSYDLVLASSALNYVRDWRATLAALARATAGYLLVTRLPTTDAASYVFVQRASSNGYGTDYPGWCLARADFLAAGDDAQLALVREFVIGEAPDIHAAPGPCQYRGYLFRRRA